MPNVYGRVLRNTALTKIVTPQSEPIPGREKDMAQNNAGGYTFTVDIWTKLDRFLILGTEGGTYYAAERKLTLDNIDSVLAAIKEDGVRAVNRAVEVSVSGRAPKNDPAIVVVVLALRHGDAATKAAATDALSKVARIGTMLFTAAELINNTGGWGRSVRRAFGKWFNDQTPMNLAMQFVKYANRNGWTYRDVLRLAHVTPSTPTHDALFTDVVGKSKFVEIDIDVANFISAVEELKATTDVKRAIALIEQYRLPREVVPTQLLNDPAIWEALLPQMGITAMTRNLATMTRVGLIAPFSDGTKAVVAKMANADVVRKSRIHPINVLIAMMTYNSGRGLRGQNVWSPVAQISSALDDMFYAAFGNIEPTNKNILLALDVSGSMGYDEVLGIAGLTPRVISAAMAMVVMRTEPNYLVMAFSRSFVKLNITPNMTLDDVTDRISNLPFEGTDCALPMIYALKNKIAADAFAVYTDNETWAGHIQPVQALRNFRNAINPGAKLMVHGMTATEFSIADPSDAGMMDVVGFDAAAPALMADFIRG